MSRFELPPQYDPHAVERPLYGRWLERGVFTARADSPKPPYVIVIPPPNVTAVLHMGQGLNNVTQDVLIRFERMRGREALWLPGTDHAGIATQNVVERLIAKEGKTRFDLGREAFVARVWAFVKETGPTILEQLKMIGASCDWSRTRFTFEPAYSRAVREVFVTLWEEGLIYRGHRVIHWCPRCLTALSDEEAESRDIDGKLYYIRYPVEGGPAPSVTVATTRPETLFGDTAVAVNPTDRRHRAFVGNVARLPIIDLPVPIIADDAVEPGFDRVIGDDRHRQVDDRQPGDFTHEGAVALVRGIHGHRRVAQQRFGARGGHGDVRRGAALHGIADVVQLAVDIPGFGLLVRQGREAARAPVDYPMAPVNEPLLPERHEHFPHRPRVGGVEGEPRPRPVAGGTDHLELLENRRAGLAHERPDPRDECLAPEVEAGLALFRDEALHHVLRGDAGVVGAGEPQRFPAAHPLEPDQHVLRHVIQPLAHVQHRRDVGRGDHDHVGRLGRVGPGSEHAALEPAPVQRALHGLWVVLGRKCEPRLGHSL